MKGEEKEISNVTDHVCGTVKGYDVLTIQTDSHIGSPCISANNCTQTQGQNTHTHTPKEILLISKYYIRALHQIDWVMSLQCYAHTS